MTELLNKVDTCAVCDRCFRSPVKHYLAETRPLIGFPDEQVPIMLCDPCWHKVGKPAEAK